ncbi:MAG: histidine kinase, partial [Nitrospirota bacterium]
LEMLPVYVVLLTPDYHVPFTNRFFRERFGESHGKCCFEYLFGRTEPCEICETYTVLKTMAPHEWEWTGPDGRNYYIFDFPFTDRDGSTLILEMGIDITEQKRSEEKLKQAREELKKSYEQLRNLSEHLQSAREEERTHIAREIHDELGQALTALKMEVSTLATKLYPNHKPLIQKTELILRHFDETIQSVKKICSELRPSVLDHFGIVEAIRWQAREFQERSGIKCDVLIEPEEITLDENLSTVIFRIFQETLTNVIRHAKATQVEASLKKKDGEIMLEVKDNGKGITEKKISGAPKSFGLIGIKERIHHFGGSLEIKGIRKKGTTLTVSIPLK